MSRWILSAAALLAFASAAARAEIDYNYQNDVLYDTSSSLYWTLGQVPDATFAAPSPWSVASTPQFYQLLNDLYQTTNTPNYALGGGVPGTYPFSQGISDFVGFFSSDAPGAPASAYPAGASVNTPMGFLSNNAQGGCSGITGNCYNAAIVSYGHGADTGSWSFGPTETVGAYGPPPLFGCIGAPQVQCAPTQTAYFVSSAAPVPLPTSIWLMLSGLAVLGLMGSNSRMRPILEAHQPVP